MKKFALLASLTALAAFAAPSAASAVVWGPAGTTSSLDSPGAGNPMWFHMQGENQTWRCTNHHLGLSVRKPASSTLDVTSATFSGCYGEGGLVNCTVTQTASSLPWTMQAVSLTDVRLNVGNVKAKFTTTPGSGSSCMWAGLEFSFAGTLGAGKWNSSTHSVAYESESGQGLKIPLFGESLYEMGLLKNGAGTLTLF